MINNSDKLLLEKTYQNVSMGITAIETVLDKTKGHELTVDLRRQLQGYQELADKSKEQLVEYGVEPKEESFYNKTMLKGNTLANTIVDSSDSHIAEMVIKGSTLGITSMTKLLHENTNADGTCTKLVKEFIEEEQKNIDTMKTYL